MSDTDPVSNEYSPSIFHESWWLDAATDNNYEVIEVTKDGKVIASLNIFCKNHLGLRLIRTPPYTRTLGPRLFLPPSKPFRRAQNIRNTIAELVKKLPAYDSLQLSLDPDDETGFAFSLNGFLIRQQFTFRIAPDTPLEEVWRDCDQKTRNLIRSADRKLTVVRSTDITEFIRMSLVDRPKKKNSHDFARLEKIFHACRLKNQGLVFSARDETGRQISCVVLVWDHKHVYFWQSARDREAQVAGANMLLLWKSIEFAHEKKLTFDFDSFASIRSAKMIASFGRIPIARQQVIGTSICYQWERAASALLVRLRDKGVDIYTSYKDRT